LVPVGVAAVAAGGSVWVVAGPGVVAVGLAAVGVALLVGVGGWRWAQRHRSAAVGLVGVAVVAAAAVVDWTWWRIAALAGVVWGAAGVVVLWRRRWRSPARRLGVVGVASWWELARTSSGWAMRARAAVVRPSLRDVSWWRRAWVPLRSYATPLCRVGAQTVWTSCEESTLRLGIPGTGKTAELGCRVVDAPGGVVVTSTAADLYELTAGLRARRGPVWVFNPGGLGGVPSTLRWSPLAGCADAHTAARRAVDLMGEGVGSAEGERWDVHGRRVLGVLLHAASLGGHSMREVAAWVGSPDTAKGEILGALDASPQAAAMRQAAEHAINTVARTRDGIMLAIAPALAWVTNPAAAYAGDPPPSEHADVVGGLVDRAGSLYLLGDDDGVVAPLVGALVAEIAHQARHTAADRLGGRLDPPLSLILDEVALICRVPLDRWLAELRKRSIVAHAAAQSVGQLRDRWGADRAATILDCAAAVLVYGGAKHATDLEHLAKLAGDRDDTTYTFDAAGRVTAASTRRISVIDAAVLSRLPNHTVMVLRRGMPPTLATTPIAWRRRDVRRATRPVRCPSRPALTTSESAPNLDRAAAGPVTTPVEDPRW